jgi:hypothetical protein
MSHKKRLYICCCSDKSSTSPIKVYAKLREIISEGKKLEERGRDWAHIYHAYLSLVAIVCICCVPLSSSLTHPILILITLASIRSLDDAYVGYYRE